MSLLSPPLHTLSVEIDSLNGKEFTTKQLKTYYI